MTYSNCGGIIQKTQKAFFTTCNAQPVCWPGQNPAWEGCSPQNGQNPINVPSCPAQSYVSYYLDAGSNEPLVSPYVQIAQNYGFANYFFQTNQGPSERAHDFLFGGTSAPYNNPNQLYYNYFVSDNPYSNIKGKTPSPVGCEAPSFEYVTYVDPTGLLYVNLQTQAPYQENPCLEHNTLVDLLDNASPKLSWKYYTDEPNQIWTAPNAINHICVPVTQPDGSIQCTGTDFTNNVVPSNNFFNDFSGGGPNLFPPPGQPPYCNLPSVSWIIPDGAFSDHPGLSQTSGQYSSTQIEGGSNWVAKIVNAVGEANCVEFNGPYKNKTPWNDTVIFVVWDDWGGWYDHIMGTELFYDNDSYNGGPGCNGTMEYLPSGLSWGCGYTYGFRVPFLVVSAYTQNVVSGSCGQGTGISCPNNMPPYVHDFGSVLAFIEHNFSLGMGCINLSVGSDGVNCNQGTLGNGSFPFADYFAPELQYSRSPGGQFTIPLQDFFNLPPQNPQTFVPIIPVQNSFTDDYFNNFNGPFTDPDNDMIDND
ncbi:MAG TPA: alkaline phosphatase family protein [Terriglobales bacterium]|nr:alkaline phosphatase family protein [Terriglobales bacterium]